jgi:Cu/Ag efflux protein CusF
MLTERKEISMLIKTPSFATFILGVIVMTVPAAGADQPPGTTTVADVRVESVASDRQSMDAVLLPQLTPVHFIIRDTALQESLKSLHKGDRLSAQIVAGNGETTLQTMSVKVVSVGVKYRALAMVGAAFAFWLVCFLCSGFHPEKLIIGEDGRFSNSKFQTVLWFGVLVGTYLATVWLRARELGGDMLGGVNIPQNLFLLSGMSAVTFTAAKGITVSKVQSAVAAGIVNSKPRASFASFWSDLTSNDCNQFDLGDFQMLVMTFLAVGVFLVLVFHFWGSLEARTIVDLPDVDTTILASFGLGHGAYLTKKAVGNVGDT